MEKLLNQDLASIRERLDKHECEFYDPQSMQDYVHLSDEYITALEDLLESKEVRYIDGFT